MKLTICLVFVLLSFGSFAQKGDSLPCPKIKLDAQRAGRVSVGTDAVISVRPFKKNLVNPDSLAYEWISDIGVIKKGKNERSVHIDTKGLVGQQIKAAVIVHGLRPGGRRPPVPQRVSAPDEPSARRMISRSSPGAQWRTPSPSVRADRFARVPSAVAR